MKTFPSLILAAAFVPALALAQPVLDANDDGMGSLDELQLVHPDIDAETFMQADSDGDALLNADELAAAQEAGLIPMQEG